MTVYPLGRGGDLSEGEYQSFAEPDPDLMGEFAYLAACDEMANAPAPGSLMAPAGEWHTRDGRSLRVAEMSSDHLHPKLDELRAELASR